MNYRSLIPMTPAHDPVIDGPLPEGKMAPAPTQVEPTDAPRYTAGSGLRSLLAETLDLLPPAQNIVNTTPPAPVATGEVETARRDRDSALMIARKMHDQWQEAEADRAPDLIVTVTRAGYDVT